MSCRCGFCRDLEAQEKREAAARADERAKVVAKARLWAKNAPNVPVSAAEALLEFAAAIECGDHDSPTQEIGTSGCSAGERGLGCALRDGHYGQHVTPDGVHWRAVTQPAAPRPEGELSDEELAFLRSQPTRPSRPLKPAAPEVCPTCNGEPNDMTCPDCVRRGQPAAPSIDEIGANMAVASTAEADRIAAEVLAAALAPEAECVCNGERRCWVHAPWTEEDDKRAKGDGTR